ncbi:MAG: N-acetyltransferase family protein [Pseudomonadota bacterium]
MANGHSTFRETPHDWESFSTAFCTRRGLSLVAERAGAISGWAGVSPTSIRPVYSGVGEVSIYVARDQHGSRLGRCLLKELILESEHHGYWTLVAQIFPENKASLALHAAVGFSIVGSRQRLGKMSYGPFDGLWRDVVMSERRS